MTLRETLSRAHRALDDAGVDHALIGRLALALWGINRATGDVDFPVEAAQRAEAEEVFKNLGFRVYASSAEVLQLEGFGKVDLFFAQRPLRRKMLVDDRKGI